MDPTMLMQFASMFGGGSGGGQGHSIGGNTPANTFGGQRVGSNALFGGGHLAGLGQVLSGLFGDSGAPYRAAEKELGDFYNRGRDVQNPFMQFGQQAMPKMNQWLSQMKDPSGFINHLMGNYSESPWAKYQQEQALRAAGNAGSVGDTAAGGLGSTPMAQFEQQNARNISSQDMNTWLQNVLGVNTTYGQGLNNQLGYGQHAADQLTDLNKQFGEDIAGMAYGKKAGEMQDRNSIWGGLFG